MKKIIIRVESHSKNWVWWMESRILEFCKILKNNFIFLTNSKFLIEKKYFWEKIIYSNYFTFWWILKDIFTFRKADFIDSNWFRDNLIASLNFLIFFPFYKIQKTKLFLTIHWNQGFLELKWFQKFIYNFIFQIWIFISDKIIVVSEELKDFLMKNYKIKEKNIEVIANFVKFSSDTNYLIPGEKTKKKAILVSRIDKSKAWWILESIDFCLKNDIFLDIYGNWENLEILKEKFKNEKSINFLWFKKQNKINYENYFLIFAMWRALLEWISNNLIWILIWYEKIISEVNLDNYKEIKYSNFSWRWIKIKKIDFENLWENKIKIFEKVKNDFDIKNLKDFYK